MAEKESQTSVLELQQMSSESRGQDCEEPWFATKKVISCFRKKHFREYQQETIEEIAAALESGRQFIVLEAPTGSGKSEIAASFARSSEDAHILTVQKVLQRQYKASMPDFVTMKGRNAYQCDISPVTCAKGPCQKSNKYQHKDCPYKQAKALAKAAPVTVHNLHSFYYQNLHKGGFAGRKLLIVDEAHALEPTYLEFMSFTLDNRLFETLEIPKHSTVEEYSDFVSEVSKLVVSELTLLNDLYDVGVLSDDQLFRRDALRGLHTKIVRFCSTQSIQEYVVEYGARNWHGETYQFVTFKPLYIGAYITQTLFPYGQRVLLMSATILDKEMFCRNIGLDSDSVELIRMPSVFPAENRKIVYSGVGMMSHKHIQKTLPKLIDEIERILDKFPNRKGIIQTHSERIANYIKAKLPEHRLTFNKDFRTPDDMLEVHRKKEGSIIVASGLREGIDLKGNLSRIQIFCKVPYPDLSDKRVARRLALDPTWYSYQTALLFVQALGRSVRSKTDKALTFVLDGGFYFFYKKSKRFIPKYIQEAIVWKSVK